MAGLQEIGAALGSGSAAGMVSMRGCGASDCGPTAGMPVLAAGRALAARKLARCTLEGRCQGSRHSAMTTSSGGRMRRSVGS